MLKDWLEKNLQEPFFMAEMAKARANLAPDAELSLAPIKAMAVFGTVYMAFCAYWFVKYIAG